MAGQTFTWQISKPNIGTGVGRVSSAYNVDGKSPFATITIANPTGYIPVNPSSNDPVVKKLSYAVRTDGVITYQYDDGNGNKVSYNSIQDLANDFGISGYSASTSRQIQSAIQSNLTFVAQQKKIGSSTIASLPSTAAQPGTGPEGNQVGTPVFASNEQLQSANLGIRDLNSDTANTVNSILNSINIVYPKTMSSDQDRIKFTLKQIKGRTFGSNDTDFTFGAKKLTNIGGTVILPIQPSITDSNGVEWGGSTLNPLEAYAARQSVTLQQSDNIAAKAAEILTKDAPQALKNSAASGDLKTAITLYLAQEAVGIQGLLSRATGAIVNPNLELLFNGPTLRSFNFTFRLSPRESKEAEDVKKIIYFFKAAMSVRKADSGVFLKAPYIFSIQYFSGNSAHKSLNKIKDCALLGCDVDYTPDGSYMTFNDEGKTMTSYQLTLRFSELDPIYNTDYADTNHSIGY
jgi:hypothetical protein